jgi:hypothetical protein
MVATIRGHQAQFKIFENGSLKDIINVTKVTVNQDSSFSRSYFVGAAEPVGDQTIEGWSGSVDLEVGDKNVDTFIDALIANNLNGIGVSDYSFIVTENYPDGQTQSHVYYDVQFKMSRDAGGLNAKITKKLDFQASGRKAL